MSLGDERLDRGWLSFLERNAQPDYFATPQQLLDETRMEGQSHLAIFLSYEDMNDIFHRRNGDEDVSPHTERRVTVMPAKAGGAWLRKA
jgi:hypothetical protein